MLDMKKNHELFWILEVLLLTPVVLFASGLLSATVFHSTGLLNSVLGSPIDVVRSILVTIICPGAAAWFAFEYLHANKKVKDARHGLAKVILLVSLLTIVTVLAYQFTPRA